MKVSIADIALPTKGTAVLLVAEEDKLAKQAEKLDKQTEGRLTKAMKLKGFKGKEGEVLTVLAPAGTSLDSVVLVGTGKGEPSEYVAETTGSKLLAELLAHKATDACVVVEGKGDAVVAAHLAYGALLRTYRFDKYRTTEKKEDKPVLKKLEVQCAKKKEADTLFKKLEKVAAGIFLARDVVSEPPNVIYPDSYAQRIKKEFTGTGAKVTILDVKQLQKLGMGALLGVGQGSAKDSRVVTIEWNGDKKSKKTPIAFVGKGVTFDTGGISIKPSAGMEDMKYDMGGSAAVVGTMKALVGRKAKVNAVGVVGLVENMPDGNAQRPSDIVTSMSGQTIEVLNTDAEGRLVLADALWYAQEKFKPERVIDLATLTGAIVIALANQYAGLFSNDDTLSKQLADSGEKVHERFWRFPLGKEFDKMIDSQVADMQNIGNGRGAGSITAAQFLQRFIKKGVAWAHLDIAGMAWDKEGSGVTPKGAVGFGVRALNRWVEDNLEK